MGSYLVTGGAGFIGSHLVERLVDQGETVRVLDDLSSGKLENLAPWRDRVDFVEGSLCDPDAVTRAVQDVEYVFHEGAIPSVPKSIKLPRDTHRANVEGTFNLLLAARDAGVKRLVFASSSSIYGDQPELPKHEGMTPSPISPYALHKRIGEEYLMLFNTVYNLQCVALRYFNVFGPRQDPGSMYSGVISLFTTALLEDRSPTIYGDGLQSRDFTYVSNVVEGNMLAMHSPKAPGQIINIATGNQVNLLELVEALQELTGNHPETRFAEARAGDVKHSLAAIDKAAELLDYHPTVDFREGLARTVAWYRGIRAKD